MVGDNKGIVNKIRKSFQKSLQAVVSLELLVPRFPATNVGNEQAEIVSKPLDRFVHDLYEGRPRGWLYYVIIRFLCRNGFTACY